jgi:hypothetical protein
VERPQRGASVLAQHILDLNIGQSSLEVAAFSSQRTEFGLQLSSRPTLSLRPKKIGAPRVKLAGLCADVSSESRRNARN